MQTTPPGRNLRPGMVLKAEDLTQIQRNNAAMPILTGPGTMVSRSSRGQVVRVRRQASVTRQTQYKLSKLPGGLVQVGYGILNTTILPTLSGRPLGVRDGDGKLASVAVTGNGYIYLDLTLDTNAVPTAAEVKFAVALPDKTDVRGVIVVGAIQNWTSTTYDLRQLRDYALGFRRCGGLTGGDDVWAAG